MMKNYVSKKTELEVDGAEDVKKEEISTEKLSISEICSSSVLDEFLTSKNTELRISYSVPRCMGADYVSNIGVDELNAEDLKLMDTAGLGLKRKTDHQSTAESSSCSLNNTSHQLKSLKAKTLSEKRQNLQADILKYGVAAVEKMYPRQYLPKKVAAIKPSDHPRHIPIKMKPKPFGFDFEELDARAILKPLSHDKYIREPPFSSVVYISRRKGLVPLSSLCKDATTVMPSNVKFMAGRNARHGKPSLYVKDGDRVLAVGGSRRKRDYTGGDTSTVDTLTVIKVPKLMKKPGEDFIPFEMDEEYSKFAVSAVRALPKRFTSRVDIRSVKREMKSKYSETNDQKQKDLKTNLNAEKSFATYLLKKLGSDHKDSEDEELPTVKEEDIEMKESSPACQVKVEPQDETVVHKEESDSDEADTSSTECENLAETPEKVQKLETVHNGWSSSVSYRVVEFHEDKPVVTESFKKRFEERKRKQLEHGLLNGFEECDVVDCFCKEPPYSSVTGLSTTENVTPVASGSQTPVGSASKEEKKKVTRNLNKVRRALKVLGVNFFEFDEENKANKDCDKEFCRLGCICDTLNRKPFAPMHCGKYDCMFLCSCNEDALNIAASSSTSISTADSSAIGRSSLTEQGSMVQLRSTSLRGMAVEEQKFANTVVATGGGEDILMLGTSAKRQKRERKLPSRFQDTDAFDTQDVPLGHADPAGKFVARNIPEVEIKSAVEPTLILSPAQAEARQWKRTKKEHLDNETIQKCSVLIPRLDLPEVVHVWCMYHCVYNCPCSNYKDPTDFAPDVTLGRNVAKRTIGGNFKSIKQVSPRRLDSMRSNNRLPLQLSQPHSLLSKPEISSISCDNSARTFGVTLKASGAETKLPHKFVVIRNDERPLNGARGFVKLEDSSKVASDSRSWSSLPDKASSVPIIIKTENDPINLNVMPRGKVQYVRWNILRSKFESHQITIWCFFRHGKPSLFVTRGNDLPYVRNALDIRKMRQGNNRVNLPSMVEALLQHEGRHNVEADLSKFAILKSNGLAWELTGVLQRKSNSQLTDAPAQPSCTPEDTPKPEADVQDSVDSEPASVTETAAVEEDQEATRSCFVSLESETSQLPAGKNLVTMTKNFQPVMQIKLPMTSNDQHWATLKVEGKEGSILCPGSNLALKVTALQQATVLALTEQNTVRIPIPKLGEPDLFGAYAVPGLKSHVFVGPFANRSKQRPRTSSAEIICLDEDGEEVTELDSNKDQKKPIGSDVKNEKDQDSECRVNFSVKYGDLPSAGPDSKKVDRVRAVLGQVPQVVPRTEECKTSVEVVDLSDSEDEVHDDPTPKKLSYLNLPLSQHGRIVYRQGVNTNLVANDSTVVVESGKNKVVAHIAPGKVTFAHPKFANHEVVCVSVEKVKAWLAEFAASENAEPATKPNQQRLNASEPIPEADVKSRPKQHVARVFQNGDQKSAAILIDRRKEREERSLFFKLYEAVSPKPFKKNLSSAEILNSAVDIIKSLTEDQKRLEEEKKTRMIRRTKLFEEFTRKLEGLPVAVKKKAVMDLKELLKKKEDSTKSESCPDVHTPSSSEPLQQTDDANSAAVIDSPEPTEKPSVSEAASVPARTPYSDITGLQTIKKDGKVMRPMNAFMLWAKGYRKELIAQGIDGATVSKMLADKWKSLDDEHKQQFYQEADHLKNLHHIQHPNYKYSPKARKPGLPKKSPKSSPEKCAQDSGQLETSQAQEQSSSSSIIQTSEPLNKEIIELD